MFWETPEDNLQDGPGEVTPEADVAEAKGLHDLVQVLHVLPEISIQFRAQERQYVPNLLILKLILRWEFWLKIFCLNLLLFSKYFVLWMILPFWTFQNKHDQDQYSDCQSNFEVVQNKTGSTAHDILIKLWSKDCRHVTLFIGPHPYSDFWIPY